MNIKLEKLLFIDRRHNLKTFLILVVSYLFIFISFSSCNEQNSIEKNLINIENNKLDVLRPHLENHSVVGLGEFTHGDGKLFELKTEIIKYLHQELGYEAVLMESDFIGVDNVIPSLKTMSLKEAASTSIQSTWAHSKEYLSLIKYLKTAQEEGDTLFFHGFDPQLTGTEALGIHQEYALSIKEEINFVDFQLLNKAIRTTYNMGEDNISNDSLSLLNCELSNIRTNENYNLDTKTKQWLKNIEGNLRRLQYIRKAPPITPNNIPEVFSDPNILKAGSLRDSLMSENIQFYLNKYEKVILWAANNHLQFTPSSYKEDRIWLGKHLKDQLGDDYYAILVAYNKGEWSYPNGSQKGTIPEAMKGTLVHSIANITDAQFAFLPLNDFKQQYNIVVRSNNWTITDSIKVSDYTDGILYINEATGSTEAN